MASLEKESLYKEATFKKLKKLTVSCYKSPRFSSEMLFFLFSSPELKSVSLFGCDALTNEVLEKAASLHKFRNLEVVYFSFCDFVSKKGIDILMNERNPLREVVLKICDMITKEHYEGWKNKVRKENLDITFRCVFR